MDIEFHYYIVYYIALKAGFKSDEAYKIAYSSQLVDDNTVDYTICKGSPEAYHNYISQTSDITKPEKDLMRVYPVFHFMPGNKQEIEQDMAMRRDGKFHILNTIPDNSNSHVTFKEAFNTKNLYRIGIATHMFADTFAHQNFVGYYESCNAKVKEDTILEKIIPDVGHADFQHNPDWPGLIWKDTRLIKEHAIVDNKKRFLEAAGRIYEEYRLYLDPNANIKVDKKELIEQVDKMIGNHDTHNEGKSNRIKRYIEFIRNINNSEFIEYNECAWFNNAVEKNFLASIPILNGLGKYTWKKDYRESDWYKFQQAIKEHQWFVTENVLNPITSNLELERM